MVTRARCFFYYLSLVFAAAGHVSPCQAQDEVAGAASIAIESLSSTYGALLNSVAPGAMSAGPPTQSDPKLEELREVLRKLGLDPERLTKESLRRAAAEELRNRLRAEGVPNWLINLIVRAFLNGVPLANPFQIREISMYNELLEAYSALEKFLDVLERYDSDEQFLGLNDLFEMRQAADRNAECGNNDGDTTLEEIVCYVYYLEENSSVVGWKKTYESLIDEINDMRRLLGLPPLDPHHLIFNQQLLTSES